ncbi:hypothetical protein ACFP3Q_13350 [Nocardioides sp. GCM10027113]|uniref:hypothetical protein n=1 Tax=unclassified Nocardioides TaxID=2615069 RepID=UPI00360C3564
MTPTPGTKATHEPLPAVWSRLVDDAAVFPPGDAPLDEAVAAYTARGDEWCADLVGSFVVTDVKVPEVADAAPGTPVSLSIVVTGGAGAIAGALRLADKAGQPVAGIEIALRDLDDLSGNARRVVAAVDAARGEGLLDDGTPVFVELPQQPPSAAWLAAADEVAAAELRLKFRTGGVEAAMHPDAATLAGWVDAALDRETPFKCTAGLHHAVRHTTGEGFEQHGFVNVLLATRALFDGTPVDAAAELLETREPDAVLAGWRAAGDDAMAGARRWFTSFGSCSVTDPLDDLTALGLLEAPR